MEINVCIGYEVKTFIRHFNDGPVSTSGTSTDYHSNQMRRCPERLVAFYEAAMEGAVQLTTTKLTKFREGNQDSVTFIDECPRLRDERKEFSDLQ